jgi:hypothetical protein
MRIHSDRWMKMRRRKRESRRNPISLTRHLEFAN